MDRFRSIGAEEEDEETSSFHDSEDGDSNATPYNLETPSVDEMESKEIPTVDKHEDSVIAAVEETGIEGTGDIGTSFIEGMPKTNDAKSSSMLSACSKQSVRNDATEKISLPEHEPYTENCSFPDMMAFKSAEDSSVIILPTEASQTGEHDKPLETFQEEQEEGVEEEEEEEEEEQEPEFDREALMERYYATITEREKLQQQNYLLQHKLAELFRKKKADENRQDYDKNANDQDSKYVKYMAQLDELRKQDSLERDNYELQIEELKDKCEHKKEMVDEERKRFMEFKKHVALNSVSNRSGKPIPPKDIDQYLSNEMKKESEVVNVRLENIKLKNKLKKKEMQLKSKEELAENLHLIDFEQLKIENQTYNEKIEERNEELLKLRKKITSTVQVLTHLKEKLQFVQAENQVQKTTLREVESEAAMKRDILSRTKQARDALRIDNQRLRQNCGLLGNESLLRDFEERKDEGDDLRHRLESLKMEHAELTLNCNQVRRKIEQARASHG